MPPRIKAIYMLALALLRTLVRRLFTRPERSGLEQFHLNYAADRLPAVSADERERMVRFNGCMACGLCDRGEGQRIAASKGLYRGVMSIVVAASRSMPDYQSAALSIAHVPDSVLEEKERMCPAHVPIVDIVRFVRDKAEEAREHSPGETTAHSARSAA